MIIAIDGPAGSGKSTVAKGVAAALGLRFVNTGALYRCVALDATRRGIGPDDEDALRDRIAAMQIAFERGPAGEELVALDGEDVSLAIRQPQVSSAASAYSAKPVVRAGLLELQRRLAHEPPGSVLEGRDIGTVVCPDAEHKFFLTARAEVRARRRYDELVARGEDVDFEEILAATVARDEADMARAVAPLRQADDATAVDSSNLDAAGVIRLIVDQVRTTPANDGEKPFDKGPTIA